MRTVHELTGNELDELRDTYFAQLTDLGEENFDSPIDIPMDNVIAHYEATYFTEDDFFCNQPPKPKTYTRDEIITITNNMHQYGGGFMKALSECIHRADHENLVKLQSVFADDFEKYLKF